MRSFKVEKSIDKLKRSTQIISLIVPVYNVAPYLSRCLESILLQSYSELEIILVDDGSTDTSGRICDEWREKDSRIIVIHQDNKGVSCARNTGLKIATGEYIGFIDPDDYVDVNMYMDLYCNIVEKCADIAACSFVNEFENGDKPTIVETVDKVMTSIEAIKYDLSCGMFITCNKLFSRRTCYGVFYDETVINGEDRLFDIMALLNSEKVVYINRPYYHYCHRVNSAGTKKYTSKDKSLINVCEKIKILLEDKDDDLEELTESQIQKAYMQLLGMMKYNFDAYEPDSVQILNKLRTSLFAILRNKYNSNKVKLKAVLLFFVPQLISKTMILKDKI